MESHSSKGKLLAVVTILLTIALAHAAPENRNEANDTSPVRNIFWRTPNFGNILPPDERYRTIDGTDNNVAHPAMGATYTQLARWAPSDYSDRVKALAGESRFSPREISNAICAQSEQIPNKAHASDFLWQWGQFLDHDISLTDGMEPPEPAPIEVPKGDGFFDPTQIINFNRSIYDVTTGTDPKNPRQQINEISTWIDGSNVYGSDSERALALRKLDGTGRLRMSKGRLLPLNKWGLPNAGGQSEALFVAGDVRANEQVGLTALHTLFVREHNRIANLIRQNKPWLPGDLIYEEARQQVIAELQVITYNEYLPALLGVDALPPYQGYDDTVDASISNIFSSALYRYGHSALSPTLLRLNKKNKPIKDGHLPLRDAFFAPHRLRDEGGIEPILRGLAAQRCQNIDPLIVDDVRNFLFGDPGHGGFDLASLNIQRGRDHGLPSYNAVRGFLELERKTDFLDVTGNQERADALMSVYSSVDEIDLWVGGLSEPAVPGAMVGELIHHVLVKQFLALRDGDRYWYQNIFTPKKIERLEKTTLAKVIRRNTKINNEIQDDVFHVSARF